MASTEFNFTVNGNKVSMTFEQTSIKTANVHYGIKYADGDETYDRVDETITQEGVDPVEAIAKLFIDLFSNLSFNKDIKTREDVFKHISEVYSSASQEEKNELVSAMIENMNIKG